MCRVYVGLGRCYVRLCERFEHEHLRGAWVFQPDAETAESWIDPETGHYVGPLGHRTFWVQEIAVRRGEVKARRIR